MLYDKRESKNDKCLSKKWQIKGKPKTNERHLSGSLNKTCNIVKLLCKRDFGISTDYEGSIFEFIINDIFSQ